MNIKEIRQLATWIADAGLTALEIKRPGFELFIRRGSNASGSPHGLNATSAEPAPRVAVSANLVKAGNPGVFFGKHPEERNSFANPGDEVSAGQLLGVLKVGRLYLPVRSDKPGRVLQVLVAEGQAVGYGQPLLELEEA